LLHKHLSHLRPARSNMRSLHRSVHLEARLPACYRDTRPDRVLTRDPWVHTSRLGRADEQFDRSDTKGDRQDRGGMIYASRGG